MKRPTTPPAADVTSDDELWEAMDDGGGNNQQRFDLAVEDCKRYFGKRHVRDPASGRSCELSWRRTISRMLNEVADSGIPKRVVEAAVIEGIHATPLC